MMKKKKEQELNEKEQELNEKEQELNYYKEELNKLNNKYIQEKQIIEK